MSANYFDLLKYAATGIASPDMTYYDKMRASTLMGGAVQTLTGQPPLSFRADGTPLISWSMKGNGSQSGTPTPDAPIMPEFVGVRTGNLCAIPSVSANFGNLTVAANGDAFSLTGTVTEISRSNNFWKRFDFVLSAGDYVIKLGVPRSYQSGYSAYLVEYDTGTTLASISGASSSAATFTLTNDTHVYIGFYIYNKTLSDDKWILMLNLGSTALPYEPYGYKIPITCAGQTTPVYLGQVSTVRRIKKLVLTGNDFDYRKNITQSDNYLYYIRLSDNSVGARKCMCTHLPLTSGAPEYDIGCNANGARVIYLNFGANVMNAQPSGNTVAGLKEYLASEYSAGHPVEVWYVLAEPETTIVNEPLAKIGDYADELHSTDAGVAIPTVKGSNTLTVDTTLQPSEMTITYKG